MTRRHQRVLAVATKSPRRGKMPALQAFFPRKEAAFSKWNRPVVALGATSVVWAVVATLI
jgi:hypothetical protein